MNTKKIVFGQQRGRISALLDQLVEARRRSHQPTDQLRTKPKHVMIGRRSVFARHLTKKWKI
jgi:hypothetical protein